MHARVIVVHGYTGYPEKNWFPWLKGELEKAGVEVEVPAMPNSDDPQLWVWLSTLKQVVGTVNEHTFFVGHSLGCPTILQYLQSLPQGQIVGGVVFVAGAVQPVPREDLKKLNHFLDNGFDFKKIRSRAHHFTVIQSADDPVVPVSNGHIMRDKLRAKYIEIPNGGHLNARSGYVEFPLVLGEVQSMIN